MARFRQDDTVTRDAPDCAPADVDPRRFRVVHVHPDVRVDLALVDDPTHVVTRVPMWDLRSVPGC